MYISKHRLDLAKRKVNKKIARHIFLTNASAALLVSSSAVGVKRGRKNMAGDFYKFSRD